MISKCTFSSSWIEEMTVVFRCCSTMKDNRKYGTGVAERNQCAVDKEKGLDVQKLGIVKLFEILYITKHLLSVL